eukprot:6487251-Amphidinium_carterae.1
MVTAQNSVPHLKRKGKHVHTLESEGVGAADPPADTSASGQHLLADAKILIVTAQAGLPPASTEAVQNVIRDPCLPARGLAIDPSETS